MLKNSETPLCILTKEGSVCLQESSELSFLFPLVQHSHWNHLVPQALGSFDLVPRLTSWALSVFSFLPPHLTQSPHPQCPGRLWCRPRPRSLSLLFLSRQFLSTPCHSPLYPADFGCQGCRVGCETHPLAFLQRLTAQCTGEREAPCLRWHSLWVLNLYLGQPGTLVTPRTGVCGKVRHFSSWAPSCTFCRALGLCCLSLIPVLWAWHGCNLW